MGIAERRDRQRSDREQRIIGAARRIAEAEGWAAVTVRRLAEEIEHSQPVLYSHFANRDAIVSAVALAGFREFTTAIRQAGHAAHGTREGAEAVATAYLAFARMHPALYEAMFTLPTSLRFAVSETPTELREAFAALTAVVPPTRGDVDLVTETYWAILHGLAELERAGRIRPGARQARVALVVGELFGP